MFKVRSGDMGMICSTFLMISISYSIVYVLITDFRARRAYGVFLVILYIQFLLFCFLCEAGIIHPLGTDHEISQFMYQNEMP